MLFCSIVYCLAAALYSTKNSLCIVPSANAAVVYYTVFEGYRLTV